MKTKEFVSKEMKRLHENPVEWTQCMWLYLTGCSVILVKEAGVSCHSNPVKTIGIIDMFMNINQYHHHELSANRVKC